MVDLNNRKVAIIGGTSGIGLATAQRLAERGADVTVGSRDDRHHAHARATIGDRARTVNVDATDAVSLGAFFEDAGPIDDLVVTVTRRGGAAPATELADLNLEDAFAGKPAAHLRAVAQALPSLDERGSVTLVGAGSAQSALPGTALLAAVNGAVEATVRPLARELAPRRVNAVSPGVIDTAWWDDLPDGQREAIFDQFSEQTPVGRIGTAQDVAHAICGLIENDYINGVVVPCDGGLRLT
jgi:NAD(P)-dependent dehydrogenase (short-subunit alcohol dehydrogenase family)